MPQVRRQTRIVRLLAVDKDIEIPAFTGSNHATRDWDFNIKLADKAVITSAHIEVVATQPALSGASLEIDVNKHNVGVISWHAFESDERRFVGELPVNSAAAITSGFNAVKLDYGVTTAHWATPAVCRIHKMVVYVNVQHNIDDPPTTGKVEVREKGVTDRILSNLSGQTLYALLAVVLVGVAAASYGISRRF